MNAATQHEPSPGKFFDAINAYQLTEAVNSAIELGIFTAIGEGNTTAATIGARCDAAERGARILCDFLCIHGFLTKDGNEYALTADSAMFLDQRSPAYVGGSLDFLMTDRIREGLMRLTEAVRQGGTALGQGTLVLENPDWVKFARAMKPLVRGLAEMMATELRKGGEAHKVLDVAASHGLFGIAVAKQNPGAQLYASDWKNVLEVTSDSAREMGVADRFHLLPGSAFETEFGDGYDLVLIPNFLHHFDTATCTTFMQKVHAALIPGGRAAIAEHVPHEDRVTPPGSAAFSMMMLATTPAGDAYTFTELESISKDAGFARVELAGDIEHNQLVIAYK